MDIKESKWISVNEKLPEIGFKVMWFDMMFNNIDIFALTNPDQPDPDYTHWMPLPDPPDGLNGDYKCSI